MRLVKFIIIVVGQIDQFDVSIWIYCGDTPLHFMRTDENTTRPWIREPSTVANKSFLSYTYFENTQTL